MIAITGPSLSVPGSLKQKLAMAAALLLICDFSTGMFVDWANTPAPGQHLVCAHTRKILVIPPLDPSGQTTLVIEAALNKCDCTDVSATVEQESSKSSKSDEEILRSFNTFSGDDIVTIDFLKSKLVTPDKRARRPWELSF